MGMQVQVISLNTFPRMHVLIIAQLDDVLILKLLLSKGTSSSNKREKFIVPS